MIGTNPKTFSGCAEGTRERPPSLAPQLEEFHTAPPPWYGRYTPMRPRPNLPLLVLVTPILAPRAFSAEPTPEELKFFETQVRPLLVDNCFSCHGEKKQKGGLRLDSPQALLKGGKNGAVIVPGKPGES